MKTHPAVTFFSKEAWRTQIQTTGISFANHGFQCFHNYFQKMSLDKGPKYTVLLHCFLVSCQQSRKYTLWAVTKPCFFPVTLLHSQPSDSNHVLSFLPSDKGPSSNQHYFQWILACLRENSSWWGMFWNLQSVKCQYIHVIVIRKFYLFLSNMNLSWWC